MVVSQLNNLDSVSFDNMLQMLIWIDTEMTNTCWKTKSIGSLSKKSGLEKGIQEGDPVSSPVQISTFSRVAGLVDSTESLPVLVSSEEELLVRILRVQLNTVSNFRSANVFKLPVIEWLGVFWNIDSSRSSDLFIGDNLEVSVSRGQDNVQFD